MIDEITEMINASNTNDSESDLNSGSFIDDFAIMTSNPSKKMPSQRNRYVLI